jgi:TnpA family transposase
MIYWHVERRSNCIYSQLKRCSSSEVGAMIEGVLQHCTDMTIQRQYVDSHGQSEVAFAFCRLLNFDLAPRLKAIARQRLPRPVSAAFVSSRASDEKPLRFTPLCRKRSAAHLHRPDVLSYDNHLTVQH